MTRRLFLTASTVVVSVVALAACGGSGSGGIELAPSAGATQVSTPTTPKPPPALRVKPVVHITSSGGPSTPNTVNVSPSSCSTKQLIKDDLVSGSGQAVLAGESITVNYVGVLCKTGKVFDSSWQRNQPFTTQLTTGPSGVIAGWVQGIPGMRVGGRRVLIIPSNLAYGKTGSPPTIPANSTLVFVVDALSVS